mmetsp:Transcript_46344/g.53406  ORF Transcript_46344/g.53406 Transcript_46344/m.53406 type:complete len:255 (+) Transcript_46344:16-780(+)
MSQLLEELGKSRIKNFYLLTPASVLKPKQKYVDVQYTIQKPEEEDFKASLKAHKRSSSMGVSSRHKSRAPNKIGSPNPNSIFGNDSDRNTQNIEGGPVSSERSSPKKKTYYEKFLNKMNAERFDTAQRKHTQARMKEKPIQTRVKTRSVKSKYSQLQSEYQKGCLTCGGANIKVKYFGERHICLKCRNYIRTTDNKPVRLYLDEDNEIVAIAKRFIGSQMIEYQVPFDNLRLYEKKCYATFAGENELIVLLQDD